MLAKSFQRQTLLLADAAHVLALDHLRILFSFDRVHRLRVAEEVDVIAAALTAVLALRYAGG